MSYTPILLPLIYDIEKLLTHEAILEAVKQFYAFLFDITQLRCHCGQHGGKDWVFHATYKKLVYVKGPDGSLVLVTVCLKRYMCTRCFRTTTAFPRWLIKGCRCTIYTMIRLVWEREVLDRSVLGLAVMNGIDPIMLKRYIKTYENQMDEIVPEALKNLGLKTLTVAYFGETRVPGLEHLAVKDLNGLDKFCRNCENKTKKNLPFLQKRSWWKEKVIPKATHKNTHYYGAVPISKYLWFYRRVKLIRP